MCFYPAELLQSFNHHPEIFPTWKKKNNIVLLTSHIEVLKIRDCFSENCRKPIIPIICNWSLSGLGKIYIDFRDDFHSMKSWGNFPLSLELNYIVRNVDKSVVNFKDTFFYRDWKKYMALDMREISIKFIENFQNIVLLTYFDHSKIAQFVSLPMSFKMTFRKVINPIIIFP